MRLGRLHFHSPIRLTLVGRAIALLTFEALFNIACWVAAGLCFSQADGLLGIALLAWTLGLRHGLDADHISAIDNATRQMVSMGRLPITCGLWFSLGHSTIVIAVNIAIAVSVDIYDKLEGVGAIGGIVGTSVSASFLFLVAVINSWFLYDALRHRRARKAREAMGLPPAEDETKAIHGGGCLVRIVGPILKAVDRPWKLYPVGILFGFGFDTASSIALLALSAIASRDHKGNAISHGKIVVLPFLFTAGMSLVDSLDSILMLYAYAQPELRVKGRWRIIEKKPLLGDGDEGVDEGREETVAEGGIEGEVENVVVVGRESEERSQARRQERLESYDYEAAEPVLPAVGPSTLLEVDSKPDDSGKGTKPDSKLDSMPSEITSNPFETPAASPLDSTKSLPLVTDPNTDTSTKLTAEVHNELEPNARVMHTKTATMSSLSISLTLLSIAVALSISLIEIMGLIGEQCTPCREAAEAEDGGGLAGSWWRAWARANDASGYVGAAIVGCFVAILLIYHGVRWGVKRHKKRQAIEV